MTQNNEKVWLPMADARKISGMTQDQLDTCCKRNYLEYKFVGKNSRRRQIEFESLKKFCVKDNPLYVPKNEPFLDIFKSDDSKKAEPQQQKLELSEKSAPTEKPNLFTPTLTITSEKVADLTLHGDRNSTIPVNTLDDMYEICSHDLAAFKEALDMFFGVYQFETHTGITATLRTLKYSATLLHSFLRDMSDLMYEVGDLHFAPVKEGD